MHRSRMRVAMVVLMLAGTSVTADTDIHRCLLKDGTIAFQETPCPEPAVHVDNGSESAPPAAADDAFVLDTSDLNADAAYAAAVEFITTKNLF